MQTRRTLYHTKKKGKRGAPPLASLSREDTASHEQRDDDTGAHTEGCTSTRTRARTRAAVRTGERANRQPCGASSPQQVVTRMTSPAPQLEPVRSQTAPSPGAPPPPQSRQGGPRSSAAISMGQPPSPNPLLEGLRVRGSLRCRWWKRRLHRQTFGRRPCPSSRGHHLGLFRQRTRS